MCWLPNLFMILVLYSQQSECSFRFDYKYYDEIDGYLKYHIVPATWREARLRCLYEGGELTSPTNLVIQKVMRKIWNRGSRGTHTALWTGLHSTFSEGDYYSVGGVPLARMPITWAPDEPDNFQNAENCLVMLPTGNISDVMCNETFPYTCFNKKLAVVTACGTTDTDYTLDQRTGSCYKFHSEGITWSRAFMTCAAEGGHLAVIDTVGEELVLKDIFARHPANTLSNTPHINSALIGFCGWSKEGTWTTIHGKRLEDLIAASKGSWAGGQPSGGNQNCGAIFRNGLYDDIWCDQHAAFICEKSPNSLLNLA